MRTCHKFVAKSGRRNLGNGISLTSPQTTAHYDVILKTYIVVSPAGVIIVKVEMKKQKAQLPIYVVDYKESPNHYLAESRSRKSGWTGNKECEKRIKWSSATKTPKYSTYLHHWKGQALCQTGLHKWKFTQMYHSHQVQGTVLLQSITIWYCFGSCCFSESKGSYKALPMFTAI